MDDELSGWVDMAGMPATVFEVLLWTHYPEISWREPMPVTTPDRAGLACRLCIARHGFRADDGELFPDAGTFEKHLIDKHPRG